MSLASSQGCQPTASRVMVQIILKNLELCIHYFIKKFQVYDNDDDTISIITTPSMAQWCQTTASGVVSIFLKISSVRNDADNVMMQNYGIRSHVSPDYFILIFSTVWQWWWLPGWCCRHHRITSNNMMMPNYGIRSHRYLQIIFKNSSVQQWWWLLVASSHHLQWHDNAKLRHPESCIFGLF